MSTVEEIERAVEQLSPPDLARLRRWFIERDNAQWDREMEQDAVAGKLDFLFEEAAGERKAGELRDWPPDKS